VTRIQVNDLKESHKQLSEKVAKTEERLENGLEFLAKLSQAKLEQLDARVNAAFGAAEEVKRYLRNIEERRPRRL